MASKPVLNKHIIRIPYKHSNAMLRFSRNQKQNVKRAYRALALHCNPIKVFGSTPLKLNLLRNHTHITNTFQESIKTVL